RHVLRREPGWGSAPDQFAQRRAAAFAARTNGRRAALSFPLEFANGDEQTQTRCDLSWRQLRLQADRSDGEIFRDQSRSDAQRSKQNERSRQRRGKLRRRFFAGRIAQARGIALGWNGCWSSLDHRKRPLQMEPADQQLGGT